MSTDGLVKENSERHNLSDTLFLAIRLDHTTLLLRMFVKRQNCAVVALAAKIVDDIILCGLDRLISGINDRTNQRITLGTVLQNLDPLLYC